MSITEIQHKIRVARATLDQLGIQRVFVFGSHARGTAEPGSDIDLLVEFTHEIGLLELAAARLELEQLLGARVDLATAGMLRDELREQILSEARLAA